MTAAIVPFPILRRRGYIENQAAYAAGMRPEASARYLAHQIETQRKAMRRRGIANELVDREMASLEAAFRQEMLEYMPTGDA
jgi:hypothetical protein